ncbi:class II fructose-bisphosphate aldolase [Amnibacterium sp. CER49]|uniref:class II fructose-bisphosphate aldolase n=1 Tax=Amnibacterium sp. CER49 TaxID=3039161 RepID=UPI00244C1C68|nr:class II fructose-bisphosphate aldolase [Amnibacterium sp. CER49]MDH2442925.1 class II fructose-bisphosphate aldolase [Amnibacterium sp. CER49]
MPIVPLPQLLSDAKAGRYAVGYFESWDLYSLEATIAAAEAERSPVIIGIGGLSTNHQWLRTHGVAIYGRVCEALAARTSVPASILFNEADSFEEAVGALGSGYNSVMMHTQGWDWDRLVGDTSALVLASHAVGVAVEGEVGALSEMSVDGSIDTSIGAMTEVDQAVRFVGATGVDALAVAVGNVHFVTSDYVPKIDVNRIRDIDAAVDVPLVLHGGSGTPADQMRAAVEAGITKVNVGTKLKHVFRSALDPAPDSQNDPNLLIGSREDRDVNIVAGRALTDEIRRLMQVFGSSGAVR